MLILPDSFCLESKAVKVSARFGNDEEVANLALTTVLHWGPGDDAVTDDVTLLSW